MGGTTPGRHGHRWKELRPEERELTSPKPVCQPQERTSEVSWHQRSAQNQTVEVVSRLVLVTAISVPGRVAAMPGKPGSTAEGWGGLLAGSQDAGKTLGLGLPWGSEETSRTRIRMRWSQSGQRGVGVQNSVCPSFGTAHATARRSERTLRALSRSGQTGNSARAVGG